MARSSSLALAALLLVTASMVQLMSSTVLPANERSKASVQPNGLRSDQESSAGEDSRDLAHLRQLLDERYTSLETDSENDEEAVLKRRGIELLLKLLTDAKIKGSNKKKRTCKVNLGGNCATEEALSMADHWHFLNSGLSPGRRRRAASKSFLPDVRSRRSNAFQRLADKEAEEN